MKQEVINRQIVTYYDDFIAEMELCYLLVEDETVENKKYGVRIIKECIENGSHISEDNTLSGLFSNFDEARRFVDMLVKYEVSPIALEVVAEDYFCDFELIADNIA